jgi:hypothetical protein
MPFTAPSDRRVVAGLRAGWLAAAAALVAWIVGIASHTAVRGLLRPLNLRDAAFWSAFALILLLPIGAAPLLLRSRRQARWGLSASRRLTAVGLLAVALVGGAQGVGHAGSVGPVVAACIAGIALVAFAAGGAAARTRSSPKSTDAVVI